MRDLVQTCAAAGIPQKTIAKWLGVGDKRLRKLFATELDDSRWNLVLDAYKAMGVHMAGRPAEFDQAGNCIREELKPNIAAPIFILKKRGGVDWEDKLGVKHSGKVEGAGDIPRTVVLLPMDLKA
ncbi:MAG: hypothetical protein HC889_00615 [Synechococcaceae cyanobacterium SM1_2_3]|nr:hypothetical protein [Synechococcaceae cyanobacterium SM1_2_3]